METKGFTSNRISWMFFPFFLATSPHKKILIFIYFCDLMARKSGNLAGLMRSFQSLKKKKKKKKRVVLEFYGRKWVFISRNGKKEAVDCSSTESIRPFVFLVGAAWARWVPAELPTLLQISPGEIQWRWAHQFLQLWKNRTVLVIRVHKIKHSTC